jgi:nucleotide-binding universal stress UspA family protein
MSDSTTEELASSTELDLSTATIGPGASSETLLLPIGDPDPERIETLASTAAEVAGMMETTVRVLHVFTTARFERILERLEYDTTDPPTPDELVKRVTSVRTLASELDDRLRMWGTTMDVDGRVGDAIGDEIVAAARAVDAKRVLVGGRRRTPAGKVVFGSTAQRVLLDAPCPVTFVRDTSYE